MDSSKAFGRLVAGIGAATIAWRRLGRGPDRAAAVGPQPEIPCANPQGALPTLKMPTARGWDAGKTPVAAPGLKVNAFAAGLTHPRWLHVLPNGDVLAAEALQEEQSDRTLFDKAMVATMRRARALGVSPNRITLLRDADGDGVAEMREVYLDGLKQPFGMAVVGDTFYVGNTDGLVAFPFEPGATTLKREGKPLASFKPGGHWTRSLLATPDGKALHVGVGSFTNIAEKGFAAEEGRACIYRYDIAKGTCEVFASGLRNPVGMAFEPRTGELWTVVNERDGLGDETPPDYLTRAQPGGFYGWPYCYWNRRVDFRVPRNAEMVAKSLQPDYALGGHTASLGLCWMPAGTLPGFGDGMAIGQHGSWNRSKLSGYRVVFVPFEDGRPSGPPRDILSGFLARDERESYGRPVGVVVGPDKSLLVADDVGDVIWRVTGDEAGESLRPTASAAAKAPAAPSRPVAVAPARAPADKPVVGVVASAPAPVPTPAPAAVKPAAPAPATPPASVASTHAAASAPAPAAAPPPAAVAKPAHAAVRRAAHAPAAAPASAKPAPAAAASPAAPAAARKPAAAPHDEPPKPKGGKKGARKGK